MKGHCNDVKKQKNYIWKTKLASELPQFLLTMSLTHWAKMSLPWHSSEMHCTRVEKRWAQQHEPHFWHLLTNVSGSLLASSAGVTQHRGQRPKLFSHRYMVDFHAVIPIIGSSLCRDFRCYWIVSQWTKKAKRNYMIQSDLAAFGFRVIIAVYFTGFESCTNEWSCICSARIW